MVVVELHIPQQSLLQVLPAVKVVRPEHVSDAAIEALDHPIRLGRSGLGQAVLYAQLLAQLVKLMLPSRLALSGGKQAIRELLAVVGEHLADPDRTSLGERFEKAARTGSRLVFLDRHKHPAGGAVYGHEQIAPAGLVLHLRQVFHIDVHIPWLIRLEGLVLGLGAGRHELAQITYAMAAQAAIEPRARGLGAQELPGNRKQIIQGQQEAAAQVHDDRFLRGTQGGLQAVCGVGAIDEGIALFPLVDGGLGDAVALGEHTCTLLAGGDLGAYCRGGAGVFVQGDHHGVRAPWLACSCSSIRARKMARAMNRGERRESI